MSTGPTILLSVGDTSGDPYAAELVGALRRRHPEARFLGMGGEQMAKAGVELLVHQHELAIGGIVELAGSLGRVVSAWRRLVRALDEARPDLVILVDTADFNLPFARRARRRGARVLYYVLPQVWAWRRGRIHKLAQRADRLAVILPFEAEVYREAGVEVDFVGHPLLDTIDAYRRGLDRARLREAFDLPACGADDPRGPVLGLFPGSRRNELDYQLPLQLEVAATLRAQHPDLQVLLGLAPSLSAEDVRARIAATSTQGLRLQVVQGRTYDVLAASDVVLAKPGTLTLEAALLERPLVVAGRGHAVSAWLLRRFVRVPSWAMPNLIAGEQVVPEYLQEAAEPAVIAAALGALLGGEARERQLQGMARVRERLGAAGATARIATIAEEMLGAARA